MCWSDSLVLPFPCLHSPVLPFPCLHSLVLPFRFANFDRELQGLASSLPTFHAGNAITVACQKRAFPFLGASAWAERLYSACESGRHDGACLLLCRALHPEAKKGHLPSQDNRALLGNHRGEQDWGSPRGRLSQFGNGAVAGWRAFEEPGQVEAGDLRAGAAFVVQVNPALARRAGPAGR